MLVSIARWEMCLLRGVVPLLVVLLLVAGLVVFLGLGASLKSSGIGTSGAVRYGVSSCSVGNISVSVFAVHSGSELDVFYTVTPPSACYSVTHIDVKPVRLGGETVLRMTIEYSLHVGQLCSQAPTPPISGTYTVYSGTPPRKITVIVTSVSQLNETTSTECTLTPSG